MVLILKDKFVFVRINKLKIFAERRAKGEGAKRALKTFVQPWIDKVYALQVILYIKESSI